MKKIITALANPKLNEKLKNMNEFELNYNDIQYQDGVIEILKKNEKIDILILSEILPGEYNIEEFILEIKKYNKEIEIIIFLENKKEELEIFLKGQGIFNIYYNNEIEVNKIIDKIHLKEKNNSLEIINNLIKENLNTKIKKVKNKIENKKILENEKENKLQKNTKFKNIENNKIITISGVSGVGKSIFTINLAMSLKDKKILIIDLDILNNCIHTILGIKRKMQKEEIKLNNLIIKYNNKIDVISMSEILENKIIEKENIKEFFNSIQNKYDFIFIDMSLECFWKQNKKIMENSFLNLFLIEANLIEIKKSKRILEIYNKEWNIKKEKINIIFNKYNINSINKKILRNIFSEYKIIGKINYDLSYNLLINKNYKCKKQFNKIKKEYVEILKKI